MPNTLTSDLGVSSTKRSTRIAGLDPPASISPRVYFFSLIGPLALSASLGIQLLLIALLVVKPPGRNVDELSDWGVLLTHPEWDIVFYVGAILVTMAVGISLVRLWNRRLETAGDSLDEVFLLRQTLFQVTAALAATALFFYRFEQARARPPLSAQLPDLTVSRGAVFALIAAATAGAALAAGTGRGAARTARAFAYLDSRYPMARKDRRWWSIWDLITPAVVVAFMYVTTPRQVAGRVFLEETLLHWDYFAMGPALSFRHGFALGSEIHSAYGVGWPLVFSALSGWLPLSYGRMIQIASIHSCLYFAGVYLFLRLIVRRPLSAAIGTGLAMLPYFVAMEGLIIWRVPNVTAMRWPFDICCFIALVMYSRTKSRLWAVAAGALVGLAVLFVIDTGMELTAAFGFFWLSILLLGPDRARMLRDLMWAGTAALGVLVAGLAVAGRGRIFSTAFVKGWLEAPLEFGGGFGMLPVLIMALPLTIAALSALFLLYMTQVGYSLSKAQHSRTGATDNSFELITGLVALYGLLILVKYMGHSAELIFFRLLIPTALLVTILLDRAADHYRCYVRHAWGRSIRSRLAIGTPVLAGLLALFFLAGPSSRMADRFLAYPNLVSARVSEAAPEGLCLVPEPKDLCGLPVGLSETVESFQTIVDRLETVKRHGETFGVIDETGSLFHAATDTAPFGRYSRIFATTPKKRLIEDVARTLDRSPPDYILTLSPILPGSGAFELWSNFGRGPAPADKNLYSDTWRALLEVVHRRYQLETEVGPYEIWKLTDPA